jgi:hypothetical protein
MKTLVLSIIAMFLGMNIAKVHGQLPNHVVTTTDTIYCSDIHVGGSKLKYTLADGAVKKVNTDEVVRYSRNGHLFHRAPVYRFDEKTNRTKLMEVLRYENGIFVLKEEHFNGTRNRWDKTFYFMANGKCLESKRNPTLENLTAYLDSHKVKYNNDLKRSNLTRH